MDQSIGSIVAVIASTVLTARIITGQSNERALSRTPTDLKLGTTVKYCHTSCQPLPVGILHARWRPIREQFPGGHE